MSLETSTILRSVLFQLKVSGSLKKATAAVTAMCSKDDIAAVELAVKEYDAADKED